MKPILSSALLRTQSDTRLAALAREGHEGAFEAIVARYREPLQRYCHRLLLPETRAQDAVQQAFIRAWSALQDGPEVRSLRPWLYRITHNTAINELKRSGYDYDELAQSLRGADAPEQELERRVVVRQTLAGLAALPERQREALLRTAVEGRTRAEVARELGVSEGAVAQLVHRARGRMRSVATAVVPLPVATWAAAGSAGGSVGVTAVVAKSGTAIAAAALIAAAPAAVHRLTATGHPRARPAPSGTAAHAPAPVPQLRGVGKRTRLQSPTAARHRQADSEQGGSGGRNQPSHGRDQAGSGQPGRSGDSGQRDARAAHQNARPQGSGAQGRAGGLGVQNSPSRRSPENQVGAHSAQGG